MKPTLSALAACLCTAALLPSTAIAQATVTVVNLDGPNEGFNDSATVAAVAGNPGTTLGDQRLRAFRAAADAWGTTLNSAVEIRIAANMDPLSPCTPTSGVLGRAGPLQAFRSFTGAPIADTFYPAALANAISGIDNDPATDDVAAQFNSSVDDDPACLSGVNWWYGIDAPAPAGTISFQDTLEHEIAHGVGVVSLVDVTTGAKLSGKDDVYSNNLHDHDSGLAWPAMTNDERRMSMTDDGDLHWIGSRVNDCAVHILDDGMTAGHVRMYAPGTLRPGSSVSHFDTSLDPDELMEPFATTASDPRLTHRLLADLGWDVNSPPCAQIVAHSPILSPIGPRHLTGYSPFHLPRGSFHLTNWSPQHHLIVSERHNQILSAGHSNGTSVLHRTIASRHDTLGSFQHDPSLSRHATLGSFGHLPAGSFRHVPIGSFHSNPLSVEGGFDPNGPIQVDPRLVPPFDPRLVDPRMAQPLYVDPRARTSQIDPSVMGAAPRALAPGLELVPGNRTRRIDVPLPPMGGFDAN